MKRPLLYIILCSAIAGLTACDEGDIIDETFVDETESYTVKFTADVTGLDAWTTGYDIVVAAFDGESDYAVIQKQLTTSADGNTTLVLSGIPTTARTVEFCVTNKLRRRIVTFESLAISPSAMSTSDTISFSLSSRMDVGMFATIQRHIFDGPAYNCSLCHGAEGGRAGLDLSEGHSWTNLVGAMSSRIDGALRVVPGSASESVLHQALAEGNPTALRYDHSNLLDGVLKRLIDDWIDGGAKE